MSDDPFVTHRSLLFTVAYEMLGSAADAEDVVQETWLRWANVGDATRAEIRDPRAYLVRIATRQALNRIRTLTRRKEEYIGEWLPEPLMVNSDVGKDIELAESVSMAMLTVLETLGPTERAVFVLREVFEMPYDEIAATVDKSQDAVRQIASRARNHVAARQPRMRVDPAEQEAVIERFLTALSTGDVQGLLDVLAPDATMIADGGGVVNSVRAPINGATAISRILANFAKLAPESAAATADVFNGNPAARIEIDGELDTAISFAIEGGLITGIYAVRNPHKLGRLGDEVRLHR